jgi:hypothetical protein
MNLKVFMNYLSFKFFLIYSPFILTRSLSIEISTIYRHDTGLRLISFDKVRLEDVQREQNVPEK